MHGLTLKLSAGTARKDVDASPRQRSDEDDFGVWMGSNDRTAKVVPQGEKKGVYLEHHIYNIFSNELGFTYYYL